MNNSDTFVIVGIKGLFRFKYNRLPYQAIENVQLQKRVFGIWFTQHEHLNYANDIAYTESFLTDLAKDCNVFRESY